ncbi:M6 family metalloprotease-like protein [Promicromonospora sp. AC04]|uniref:M6 family metalloprotease domain-containing protein n=1 Tax=Promicromonospora sp. AC04 TaxID=2135723 RepID=UPI000D352087|nr:M6 family metalloprotease domain-containing protein [Promicromonospora sp. AC04]PUB25916.1 M6 family metalloprotease-like protein [Promicromonospora sp. AC04]
MHQKRATRPPLARPSFALPSFALPVAAVAATVLALGVVPASASTDLSEVSLGATSLGATSVGAAPLAATSLAATPVAAAPLAATSLAATPVAATPTGATSVAAAPTGATPAGAPPAATCRLPAAVDGLGSGFPVDDQALPAVGTLKAALLFVDFEDHPAAVGSLDEAETNLASGVEYLERVSGGRLDVTTTSSDGWVRMPEPSTSYPFERGLSYEDHVRYIGDAIAAADATFDFSDVDVVWVTATKEAPNITYSPTTNFLDVTADDNHLTHAVTFGYDQWRWGGLVLAHESGHTLGLPDLYLFEAPPSDPGNWHAAVGGWDLMGLISGSGPEYFAWHRWQLGWLDDAQVVCADPRRATTARLGPVAGSGNAPSWQDTMLVYPISATRAVVVENRQPVGYDEAIGASGALVYTVDTSVRSGEGPVRVVDSTPGSADGLDDAPFAPGTSWTEPTTGAVLTFRDGPGNAVGVTVRP